jgi:hypothetical protein
MSDCDTNRGCGGSTNDCGGGGGCGGSFCGCSPCSCNTPAPDIEVSESKGDCTPLVRDPFNIISGDCKAPEGGDMTIKAPVYTSTFENPPDDVLRDSQGRPVLLNGKVVAKTS